MWGVIKNAATVASEAASLATERAQGLLEQLDNSGIDESDLPLEITEISPNLHEGIVKEDLPVDSDSPASSPVGESAVISDSTTSKKKSRRGKQKKSKNDSTNFLSSADSDDKVEKLDEEKSKTLLQEQSLFEDENSAGTQASAKLRIATSPLPTAAPQQKHTTAEVLVEAESAFYQNEVLKDRKEIELQASTIRRLEVANEKLKEDWISKEMELSALKERIEHSSINYDKDLETLYKEKKETKHRCDKAEVEVKNLKAALANSIKTTESLSAQLKQQSNETEVLRAQSMQFEEDNSTLLQQITDLEIRLENLASNEQAVQDLELFCGSLQGTISELRKENAELANEVSTVVEQLDVAEANKTTVESELKHKEARVAALEKQAKELADRHRREIAALEEATHIASSRLNDALEAANQRIKELEVSLAYADSNKASNTETEMEREAEIKAERETVAQLRTEVSLLSERLISLKDAKKRVIARGKEAERLLGEEREAHRAELKRLADEHAAAVQEAEQKVQAMEADNAAAVQELKKLQNRYDAISSQFECAIASAEAANVAAKESQSSVSKLQEDFTDRNEQTEIVRINLALAEEALLAAEERNRLLQASIKQREAEHDVDAGQATGVLQQAQARVNQLEQEVIALQTSVVELEADKQRLVRQLGEEKDIVSRQDKEHRLAIDALKRVNEAAVSRIAELESEVNAAREEIEVLRGSVDSLEATVEELAVEEQTVEGQLEKAEEQQASLREKLQEEHQHVEEETVEIGHLHAQIAALSEEVSSLSEERDSLMHSLLAADEAKEAKTDEEGVREEESAALLTPVQDQLRVSEEGRVTLIAEIAALREQTEEEKTALCERLKQFEKTQQLSQQEWKKELEEAVEARNALQQESDRLTAELSEAAAMKATFEERQAVLREELSQAVEELGRVRQKAESDVDRCELEIKTLKERIGREEKSNAEGEATRRTAFAEAQQEIVALKASDSARGELTDALRVEIADLTAQLAQNEEERTRLVGALSDVESERDRALSDISALYIQKEELQVARRDAVTVMKGACNEMISQLAAKLTELTSVLVLNDSVSTVRGSVEDNLDVFDVSLASSFSPFPSAVSGGDAVLEDDSAESAQQRLQEALRAHCSSLAAVVRHKEVLEIEFRSTQGSLADAEQTIASLEEKTEALTAEMDFLRSQLESISNEKESTTIRFDELQRELEERNRRSEEEAAVAVGDEEKAQREEQSAADALNTETAMEREAEIKAERETVAQLQAEVSLLSERLISLKDAKKRVIARGKEAERLLAEEREAHRAELKRLADEHAAALSKAVQEAVQEAEQRAAAKTDSRLNEMLSLAQAAAAQAAVDAAAALSAHQEQYDRDLNALTQQLQQAQLLMQQQAEQHAAQQAAQKVVERERTEAVADAAEALTAKRIIIADLEAVVLQLREEKSAVASEQMRELEDARAYNVELMEEVSVLKDSIESLKESKQRVVARGKEAERLLKELRARNAEETEALKRKYDEEVTGLKDALYLKEQRCSDLEKDYDTVLAQMQSVGDSQEELQQAHRQQILSLEAANEELRVKLEEADQTEDQTAKLLEKADSTIERLQAQLREARTQVESLDDQLQQRVVENASLHERIRSCLAETSETERRLASAEEHARTVQSTLEDSSLALNNCLTQKAEQLTVALQAQVVAEKEIASLREGRDASAEENEQLKDRLAELEQRIDTVDEELQQTAELRKRAEEAEMSLQALDDKKHRDLDALRKQNEKIAAMQRAYGEFKREHEDTVQTMQWQIEQAQSQAENRASELADCRAQLLRSVDRVQELEALLRERACAAQSSSLPPAAAVAVAGGAGGGGDGGTQREEDGEVVTTSSPSGSEELSIGSGSLVLVQLQDGLDSADPSSHSRPSTQSATAGNVSAGEGHRSSSGSSSDNSRDESEGSQGSSSSSQRSGGRSAGEGSFLLVSPSAADREREAMRSSVKEESVGRSHSGSVKQPRSSARYAGGGGEGGGEGEVERDESGAALQEQIEVVATLREEIAAFQTHNLSLRGERDAAVQQVADLQTQLAEASLQRDGAVERVSALEREVLVMQELANDAMQEASLATEKGAGTAATAVDYDIEGGVVGSMLDAPSSSSAAAASSWAGVSSLAGGWRLVSQSPVVASVIKPKATATSSAAGGGRGSDSGNSGSSGHRGHRGRRSVTRAHTTRSAMGEDADNGDASSSSSALPFSQSLSLLSDGASDVSGSGDDEALLAADELKEKAVGTSSSFSSSALSRRMWQTVRSCCPRLLCCILGDKPPKYGTLVMRLLCGYLLLLQLVVWIQWHQCSAPQQLSDSYYYTTTTSIPSLSSINSSSSIGAAEGEDLAAAAVSAAMAAVGSIPSGGASMATMLPVLDAAATALGVSR